MMFSLLNLFPGILCFVFVHSVSVSIDQYKQQLLDVHNEYRRMQKGSDMNELVWDDALSQQAANWIKRCQFEHEMKGKGENLAFDSNPNTDEALINSSMKSWYDEINMYNYNYKRCSPRSCHYTQIVWSKTRKVGCAIEKCNYMYMNGRPIKDAWYLGCWYDPKGNDISEFPYQRGKPCSQCLDQQGCSRGLCTGEGVEVCEDTASLCDYWESIGECYRNKPFMEKTCRKACQICKGKGSGPEPAPKQVCKDIVNSSQCRRWKYDCKKNRRYMEPNCKKTCGYCS